MRTMLLSLGLLTGLAGAGGAVAADKNELQLLANSAGAINAWRLTPGVLLSRCSRELPRQQQALQTSFASWERSNAEMLEAIGLALDDVAPRLAGALGVTRPQARRRLDELTTQGIRKKFFGDKRFTTTQVCERYEAILLALMKESESTMTHMQLLERVLDGKPAQEAPKVQ